MSDRQPLLNASSKLSIDYDDDNHGNKQQLLTNRFSDWRRCFSRNNNDNKYIKLDNDTEHGDKDEAVGVFSLVILMLISVCFTVLYVVCGLVSLVLFGRITGLFVIKSFGDNCVDQHQNLIVSINNNSTYPQGIELNTFSNTSSHKLRNNSDEMLFSTLATLIPSFRAKVMNIVHWLFIINAVQFLTNSIANYIWNFSVKRQISRMSILLFRSLVQR
ncbi:unnamed protein product, partial [Rotaria sp. Silwood2]